MSLIQQTSGGYWCSCGQWVLSGNAHVCPNYQQQWTYTWPITWSATTMPAISAFKGAVKTLADLPTNAAKGDAYYVEKDSALVVRDTGGWFHYDRS